MHSTPVTADAVVEKAVGASEIAEVALALGALRRIDYADHFTLTPVAGSDATAEQWARAMFGDVPDLGERFIWQVVLQLQLVRGRSQTTVAGWQIDGRGEDWIRLATASRALSVNLVVRATAHSVSLTTLLQYDGAVGRLVWTRLSFVHRLLAPGLLRDAAAKVSAAGASGTVGRGDDQDDVRHAGSVPARPSLPM